MELWANIREIYIEMCVFSQEKKRIHIFWPNGLSLIF